MTIEEGSAKKGGLLDSVKTMASTLLAMGQTRLELLSTEIEEEREWLTSMMVWTMIALFCAAIAVVLVAMLIVIIFWDSYRILALTMLILIFILGAGFAWRVVFNMARSKPRIFSSSIAEMSKDREQLSSPPPYE
jgi:uncharacterized membrane protein YqjE